MNYHMSSEIFTKLICRHIFIRERWRNFIKCYCAEKDCEIFHKQMTKSKKYYYFNMANCLMVYEWLRPFIFIIFTIYHSTKFF